MTADAPAMRVLSTSLCPWLEPALAQMERAMADERLGHAWLITGPRGIGKINLALVLAARLLDGALRGTPPEALSAPEAAAAMRQRHAPGDHHPDLQWVFPEDGKRAISVDQVREVTQHLGLKSYRGTGKAVVIEPAEAMTASAANALLKTLEEPTPSTYLLLVAHQAGRLPATIRSRCQTLVARPPAAAEAEGWLGASDAGRKLKSAARARPLLMLQLTDEKLLSEISALDENIELISQNRIDPQTVAERWLKLDLELLLETLAQRIQQAIRARFAGGDSNPVTDPAADPLHNMWSELRVGTLFDQLRTAEKLREQIGRGTNMDLAVRVLLMGFKRV